MKLGYKIKLISALDANKDVKLNVSPNYLSQDIIIWLIDIKSYLHKNDQWLIKMINTLCDERLFDLETLVEVPESYWHSLGFETIGLKKILSVKKQAFYNQQEK